MDTDAAQAVTQMRDALGDITYVSTSALMELVALAEADDGDHTDRETTELGIIGHIVETMFPTAGADAVPIVRGTLAAAVEAITSDRQDTTAAAIEAAATMRAAWVVLELLPVHDRPTEES